MTTTSFQFPSILIPHIWGNITKDFIKFTFERWQIGDIGRIDMIPRDNSDNYMAFIHMNKWYDNVSANNLRNKILRGEEGRIVYDDPWFWVTVKAKNPRLNLINEESLRTTHTTRTTRTETTVSDPIPVIRQNITFMENQAQAQGKMIQYLRDDLYHADNHIFNLENHTVELRKSSTTFG